MDLLYVFLRNKLAGTLCLDKKNRFIFKYDKAYLESEEPAPLSVVLPLTEATYTDDKSKPFFSNLLPEGIIRSIIAREKRVSENNDFALLRAVGGECAGAVSLQESKIPPEIVNEYDPVTDDELIRMMDESSIKPILISKDELRLSLAGAQNKIPLSYKEGHFYMPKGNSPSTHILKPATSIYPNLLENELFCMLLARRVGLSVPDVFLWEKDNHRAFVIERYDRYIEGETIYRLHQEDFCQAAGIPPDRKYENEGGPGVSTCMDIINRYCSIPILEKEKFINWIIFNYMIGNCDAHGKNISLLFTHHGTGLAPFYDLLSTTAYSELSTKFSMKIGRQKKINWVLRDHWKRFALETDIKFPMLEEMLTDISEKIRKQSILLQEEFNKKYGGHDTIKKICKNIDSQVELFK